MNDSRLAKCSTLRAAATFSQISARRSHSCTSPIKHPAFTHGRYMARPPRARKPPIKPRPRPRPRPRGGLFVVEMPGLFVRLAVTYKRMDEHEHCSTNPDQQKPPQHTVFYISLVFPCVLVMPPVVFYARGRCIMLYDVCVFKKHLSTREETNHQRVVPHSVHEY